MNELTEKIVAYEDGALTDEETIELFQRLLETGLVWKLQGSYGRMAEYLIEQDLINVQL
jgi:hypothetical protein